MNRIILLGALLTLALPGLGCDQCGCGALLGIQPYDRAHSFGLQYRMRYLDGDVPGPTTMLMTKHGGHTATTTDAPASHYREVYTAIDVRGQYWLGQRWSLFGVVPLVNNYAAVDGVRQADLYAVGDPQVMVRWIAANTRFLVLDSTRTRHRLTLGGGVKLPLGRHDMEQYGQELPHDLQPGTGTWDALASAEYLVRGARWGGSVTVFGRVNGPMSSGYRMGHSASTLLEAFRFVDIGALRLLPSAGAYMEYAGTDRLDGTAVTGTGDQVLFSHAGARFWWRSLGLSLAWQHALASNSGELMVPNRERIVAGITYNLNNNNNN